MRAPWVLITGAALVAACVDKGPGDRGKQIDPGFIQDNLLTAPPAAIGHPMQVRFEAPQGPGEVVYLGNDVASATVVPGDKVVVTHYWQVVEPPGPGWRVFSHVRGDDGEFMNVDLTDMRTGHPPEKWQAGQIVRDPQSFVLRKDWRSKSAALVVGFYPKGKHRIEDRMAVTGIDAPERAAPVVTFAVDVSKAPPPPGTQVVKKAAGPIVIDGKAEEAAWRGAAVQTSFTSAEGCPEMEARTEAKLTWDDQFLYLFVSSEDDDVWSPFTNHDDHLWEHDVVEVFVDADGNRRGYVELQVNPRNVHFDTWFAVGRPNRDDSFQAGMQSQVVVRGTLDDREAGDAGWDVELAIPHEAVKGKDPGMKVRVPPRPGDRWRLNVVRVDKAKDGKVRAASWNRIGCADFHALDRMLTVEFADERGNTTAEAAPAPAAAPAAPVPSAPATPASPTRVERANPAAAPRAQPAPAAPPAPPPSEPR